MKKFALFMLLGLCSLVLSYADEVIAIGLLGDEGELISPREIKEGPDGNIYVYDRQDGFIKVYTPKGKFIRKMGGQGQGPGEIQRITDVSFGFLPDEKLYFTEFFDGHPWITVMDLSGEFVRVIKLKFMERFGLRRLHPLPDGNFLAQVHLIGMPKKLKDYFLHGFPINIFLLDKNGSPVKEIISTNFFRRVSYLDIGGDAPIPFAPRFSWCYFKDDLVLFTDGLSNTIKVYDFKGAIVKEIDTSLPKPAKVTKKDLDAWRRETKESLQVRDGGTWYNQYGKVIEKYKKSIYDVKPIVSGLSRTPAGNILVAGIASRGKNERPYWLLDKAGKKLVRMNIPLLSIRITSSFIFYMTVDEDYFFHVHALRRTGSEKDDLLRLSDKLSP